MCVNGGDVGQGWIDAMDEELPQLTMFILPSGGKAASFLQMARSVRTARSSRSSPNPNALLPKCVGGAV